MERLHHRRQMRHVAPADEARRVRQAVRMRRCRRSQQQRGGVDRAARHDDERRAHAERLAVALDFDGLDASSAGVGQQAGARACSSTASTFGCVDRRVNAARLRVALRPHPARETSCTCRRARSRPARPAESARAAAATDAAPAHAARRRSPPSAASAGSARTETVRGRLRRIDAGLPVHVIQPLGPIVVRRERVVVDRPGRRHAVDVLAVLKVLAPQAIQHAAPELRVAADAVVRVRQKGPSRARRATAPWRGSAALSRPRSELQFSSSCGTKSPRSRMRIRAELPASACAIVPPPAPLPMMMMS